MDSPGGEFNSYKVSVQDRYEVFQTAKNIVIV